MWQWLFSCCSRQRSVTLRKFTARHVRSKNNERFRRSARPNITRGWRSDLLKRRRKLGKAPYFDYQSAREDIEKVLAEFKIYLKGDESTDLPPAVPLIVDGRYFSESIKDFLASRKAEEDKSSAIYRRRIMHHVRRQPRRRARTLKRGAGKKNVREGANELEAECGNRASSACSHTAKQQSEAGQD